MQEVNVSGRIPAQNSAELQGHEKLKALRKSPPENNAAEKSHRDEEAPESEHARIERLGRERPAKFKSFGAELAFCYSIIASQFMAVSLSFCTWYLYLS